jgi:hypothetical protein
MDNNLDTIRYHLVDVGNLSGDAAAEVRDACEGLDERLGRIEVRLTALENDPSGTPFVQACTGDGPAYRVDALSALLGELRPHVGTLISAERYEAVRALHTELVYALGAALGKPVWPGRS